MRKKQNPKLTEATRELKRWAAALKKAADLPMDVDVPRSIIDAAATAPMLAAELRAIGVFLEHLAAGTPWWEVPWFRNRERSRPMAFADRCMRYNVLLVKGKTPRQAAAAVGRSLATMQRHARKYREHALMLASSTERTDGRPPELTLAEVNAYLDRVASETGKPRNDWIAFVERDRKIRAAKDGKRRAAAATNLAPCGTASSAPQAHPTGGGWGKNSREIAPDSA
jgi:transposase